MAVPFGCIGFISTKEGGARTKDLFSPEIPVVGLNGENLIIGDTTDTGIFVFPKHITNSTNETEETDDEDNEAENGDDDWLWSVAWTLNESSMPLAAFSILLCINHPMRNYQFL